MNIKHQNLLPGWLKSGLTALAISCTSNVSASLSPIQGLPDLPTNQIIIKYKVQSKAYGQAAKVDQMQRVNQKVGLQIKYLRPMSGKAHVLKLPKEMSKEQAQTIANELMTLPEVEYAQPDVRVFPLVTPNDPLYPQEWSLFDVNGINMPVAWQTSKGYATVVVAVVDTGYTDHADLAGKFLPGYDFVANPFNGNDGNGRDNDAHDPGDWSADNECGSGIPALNSSWHGTHVTGTIAALTDNNMGISGINWKSKILPIRVLGKCGGNFSDLIDGMRWAAGLSVPNVPNNPYPAKVINISLGGQYPCDQYPPLQDAIDEVYNKGTIIVVAAGNEDMDAAGFIPAGCNHVLTVAATGRDGMRSYYSNYGTVVEIAAPGGNDLVDTGIVSTINSSTTSPNPNGSAYAAYEGTSMATPHVTGIVSLLVSRNPNLTFAQILQLLQSKAKPFPPGSDCSTLKCGSGIANAAGSLSAVPPITGTITSVGTYDGYIVESSENSNIGATINNTATYLYLGDDTARKQYRGILSFNTAAIPDDAVITKATLKIKPLTTNAFTVLGPLLADIKQPYFGTAVSLQPSDFQAPANLLSAATFGSTLNNGFYVANVKLTGLPFINKKSTTQFRLRFTNDDNNNNLADFRRFYSGEVATGSRPQLIIEYFRP